MKSTIRNGIIGYCLIVLFLFGKPLVAPTGQMIFGDDINHQYYFYREFFNNSIKQGIFPWWNPYLFGGEPFIANPVVNIWYPLNWLYLALPLSFAYAGHLAFHVLWAMIGMFILTGSWVSGIIFGLSGFFMARTWAGHVDVIAAASWMPWVVWAFRKKSIPVAATIFAVQLLSGYQTMAFFTVIAVGITTIIEKRSIKYALLAGLGGVGLAAFHLLPVQEFFINSIRTISLPYSWNSYGSLEWKSLLQFLNPFYFGNQYTYFGPPPNLPEHAMFVGVGGLILALIGLIRPISPMSLIAFFGFWVSLGPNAPIDLQYVLWKIVPIYHYLRIPPRHLVLVVFGLSALAGIGFHKLPKSPKLLRLLIGIIVVFEMVWFAKGFITLTPIPKHDQELVALLKQDTQPYRVLQNFGVWLPARNALDFDAVMANGIFSATGYDPSILKNYYSFFTNNPKESILSQDVQVPYLSVNDAQKIDRLNIKYIMVPPAYDPFTANSRYTLVKSSSGYRVYENTSVKPRFYIVCGDVQITSYSPNKIALTTNTTCDSSLESSEVWYPGWVAFIDGKKTIITKSEDTFRTINIPRGNHEVIYEYRPTIFILGLIISIITALLLFILR